MQARTHTILIILGDLKHAFESLLRDKHKNPALLNMYAFIEHMRGAGERRQDRQ
jgi:metallophosphoesterase superfamily enzyme